MAGQMTIPFVKDLNKPLALDQLATLFQQGDKNANILRIEMMDGETKADLSDLSGSGQAERADGYRLPLSVSVSGNVVYATITEEAYNVAGPLVGFVRLSSTNGYVRRTILRFAATVESQSDGPLLDSSNVIPSIDDLLAKIEVMEAATEACVTATTNANTAKNSANTAATRANTAAAGAEGWANATASATKLAAGSNPTVKVTTASNGAKTITFGIPQGATGTTPNITFQVATGAPGSDVQIEQSGTAAAPVVKLTIPRGDTGAVDGVDYYAGNPAALGTASPGTANGVARGNHVHPMPYGSQIQMSESRNAKVADMIAQHQSDLQTFKVKIEGLEATAMSAKMQTGLITVAAEAGVVTSQDITFDTPFNYAPAVVLSLNANAEAVLNGGNCSFSNVTATGFKLNVFRPTAGNVPVRWVAFRP